MGSITLPPRIEHQTLRTTNGSVTFDPLSVATVLPNPRANASAVRLYTQYNRQLFRWPYLMMIGGTLPALGALVDHLLSTSHSVHPALALALSDAKTIEVTSNTIFKELPIDFSNSWLAYACDYRPSAAADNDFMIINVDNLHDTGTDSRGKAAWRFLFTFIGLSNGAIIILELLISVFFGDMWATALFLIYACHWLASTILASTNLIVPRTSATIRVDGTLTFAVHQRKEGGTVIFKGRKDNLERWARQTWQFDQTPAKSFLHWFWILTGSVAALGSTAAMVNMIAPLQLGFLGLLVYSSLAELLLTRVSRHLELRPRYERETIFFLGDNDYRSRAIIRAALLPPETCKLDHLDWIQMKRLPDIAPFPQMLQTLKRLNEAKTNLTKPVCEQIMADFVQDCSACAPVSKSQADQEAFARLVDRVSHEMTDTVLSAFGFHFTNQLGRTIDEK